MLPDGDHLDGSPAGELARGDEAEGFRPVVPTLAGGVVGGRRAPGHAGGGDYGGQRAWGAVLVCGLATLWPASSAAKSPGGEAALGPPSGGARPGSCAAAGRGGQGPAGARLRGDEPDGAAVGRAPARPRSSGQSASSAPPSARGGPALEATALRLCRACPAPRPEKRALGRAIKRLPIGGRWLVLDETTLRHLPPLRAAWASRGRQAQVRISGTTARRSLLGTADLRTGRRVLLVTARQRLADFHRFLRRLRHGVGACGALWLLLDRHGSHQSPSSLRLAEQLGLRLFWLPRPHPKLNPVDHLWRGLKTPFAANRPFASVDALAAHAEGAGTHPHACSDVAESRSARTEMLAQRTTQNTLAFYLASTFTKPAGQPDMDWAEDEV